MTKPRVSVDISTVRRQVDLKAPTQKERKQHERDKERVKRVICGARACTGAEDASLVLQALGLIPYTEESS